MPEPTDLTARPPMGPFETERQARELPAVRAIYDAMHASTRRGVMGEMGHRLLCEACAAAGVELGAFDHRIVLWLAGFEPEACAAVAGLIARAHQAAVGSVREHLASLADHIDRRLADEQ